MPRLTKQQWIDARIDNEVNGLTHTKIADKYGTSRIAVYNRSKRDDWEQAKADAIISEHTKAKQAMEQTNKQISKFTGREKKAIKEKITHELKLKAVNEEFELDLMRSNAKLAKNSDDADQNVKLSQSYKNLKPAAPAVAINNNTQINITVEEKKENLELLLGNYD